MPKKGQKTVTIPQWAWESAEAHFKNHEKNLKDRKPPIRSTTKLITSWIAEKAKEEKGEGESEQGNPDEVRDLLIRVKETFLAHTIIKIANGRTLPYSHLESKKLEERIRQYILERAKREGQVITEEHLNNLTKDTLKYHKQLLTELSLISNK